MNCDIDIKNAVDCLKKGGVIIYPTDTVWGIGCDATNEQAVQRIYQIKKRQDSKAMLCLVDNPNRIQRYFRNVPDVAWDIFDCADQPVTVILDGAEGVAPSLVAEDGSLGIRVTNEHFSNMLCKQLGKPLVSSSANFAGRPTPTTFCEIDAKLLNSVDYVCHSRRGENKPARPSTIIKISTDGNFKIIRP